MVVERLEKVQPTNSGGTFHSKPTRLGPSGCSPRRLFSFQANQFPISNEVLFSREMKRFAFVATLAAAMGFTAFSLGYAADKDKDIVDTAIAAGDFKTLATALKAADLVETLKGKGPFTVFAPTDEASAKLPDGTLDELLKHENKKKLAGILTYHVVSGKVMAADVVKLTKAKTVEGTDVKLKVTDGKVTVNSAKVVKTDIVCANGVIHVIDTVLLPK